MMTARICCLMLMIMQGLKITSQETKDRTCYMKKLERSRHRGDKTKQPIKFNTKKILKSLLLSQ